MSKKKAKKKVKLPCDRMGEPIHVDDLLEWRYGKEVERVKVEYLTYYGNGNWTANEGDDFTDNLEEATIIWRKRK